MTFPNCADINLCLHSYESQTELKVIGHHNTYISDSKSSNILSDGSLTDNLRLADHIISSCENEQILL